MFVKVTNGNPDQYPYTVGDLRRDNSQTSFPKHVAEETMAEFGMFPVVSDPAPEYDPTTHRLEHGNMPILRDGAWAITKTVVPLTPEQIAQNMQALQDDIADKTQRHLDTFARTRNYDSMLSLCTYATSTNPVFAAEGQYGVEARDATWAALYVMLAEVQAGTRPVPSGFSDIKGELPVLTWPN